MSEDTKVFDATLKNGIRYEIHESVGFSGRSEIALKVEGRVIFVLDTEVKRTGNIICKPLSSKFLRIKKDPEPVDPEPSLDLDDVLGDENTDSQESDQEEP